MTNNTSAEHRYAARLESIKNSLERLSQARSHQFHGFHGGVQVVASGLVKKHTSPWSRAPHQ